jgi:protein phosphatase methylesterase 1
VDLGGTEPYWRGWFEQLSAGFLSVPASKLLLLAGVDRLDRDLTVGQMQVKRSTIHRSNSSGLVSNTLEQ